MTFPIPCHAARIRMVLVFVAMFAGASFAQVASQFSFNGGSSFNSTINFAGTNAYTTPVIAVGTTSSPLWIDDYNNTSDNHPHFAFVVNSCGSTTPLTCLNGSTTENLIGAAVMAASRPSGNNNAVFGLNVTARDESGGTAAGKGEIRVFEGDMASPSGVTFNGSGQAADYSNTGYLANCAGGNDCGIGFIVNHTGGGNWKQGMLIENWSSDGTGLQLLKPSAASPNAVLLDTQASGDTFYIQWNDGPPGNLRWTLGKNSSNDLTFTDATGVVNRLSFMHPVSGNGDTIINASGTGTVRLAYNNGSGGVCFGGTGSTCPGSTDSNGNGTFRTLISYVATGTAPLAVSSSTPVTNLTVSNHPQVYIAGTQAPAVKIYTDTAALSSGTVTFTFGSSFAFSNTKYRCSAQDTSGAADATSIGTKTTTTVVINGTGSHTIDLTCIGT